MREKRACDAAFFVTKEALHVNRRTQTQCMRLLALAGVGLTLAQTPSAALAQQSWPAPGEFAAPPNAAQARIVVTNIFRVQDLVDGFFARIAPKLDSAFEAAAVSGPDPVALKSGFTVDLAPSLPPGGGGPGGPAIGLVPSPLAALVATKGTLGVAYVGHAVSGAEAKSGRLNVVITAHTDVVLTDAADSKTISLKKGAQIRYAFIWSKTASGRKTYSSTGEVDRLPTTVVRLGQKNRLDFSTKFNIAIVGSDTGGSTGRVSFDDLVVWLPAEGTGGAPQKYETAFIIDDAPSQGAAATRILHAATYAVNGTGLSLDFSADEI